MFNRLTERADLRFHADKGRSILMLAPCGIGKTWLINRFAEDLRKAGWTAVLCDVQDISQAPAATRARPPFPIGGRLRDALIAVDTSRNIAGQRTQANVGGVLPISFCGGPDRVIEQIRRCRDVMGTRVLDISLTDPGTDSLEAMMDSLALFGHRVLPRVRDI